MPHRYLLTGMSLVLAALTPVAGYASEADPPRTESRWSVEARAGRFEPDIDGYLRFYDDKRSRQLAVAFAYRFNRWLEAGGEIGRSRDTGMGQLPSGDLGGHVEYTLMPAQAYASVRWERRDYPLIVPYLSVGLVRAYYRQRIELQPRRRGRTDLGSSLRAGFQLSLDRLDPGTAFGYGSGPLKRTFLFLEAQRFTTEVADVDLGGDIYAVGFRFEFGPPGRAVRRP